MVGCCKWPVKLFLRSFGCETQLQALFDLVLPLFRSHEGPEARWAWAHGSSFGEPYVALCPFLVFACIFYDGFRFTVADLAQTDLGAALGGSTANPRAVPILYPYSLFLQGWAAWSGYLPTCNWIWEDGIMESFGAPFFREWAVSICPLAGTAVSCFCSRTARS